MSKTNKINFFSICLPKFFPMNHWGKEKLFWLDKSLIVNDITLVGSSFRKSKVPYRDEQMKIVESFLWFHFKGQKVDDIERYLSTYLHFAITFFIKHEYLRSRAYICLSLSSPFPLVIISQFWPLSRYSCFFLGSLHPRNFLLILYVKIIGWSHHSFSQEKVCLEKHIKVDGNMYAW